MVGPAKSEKAGRAKPVVADKMKSLNLLLPDMLLIIEL